MFNILATVAAISAANLTIREQTRLAENPNQLRWPAIAPRVDAKSIKINELTKVDFRAIGSRRAFNAGSRELAERLGPQLGYRIMPAGVKHTFDEEYLQLLRERFGTNPAVEAAIAEEIIKDVDRWPTFLSDAVDRLIEVELFEAWYLKQITVRDPETPEAIPVDLLFDADRYPVEGTDWRNGAVNAYDRFVYHLRVARRKFGGSVGGARMRQAVYDEIVKDAPVTIQGYKMTQAEVEKRVQEEGFAGFKFIIDERTYDPTNGTGAAADEFYVPQGRIAFQPQDGRIAQTHFAPVTRAWDYVKTGATKTVLNNVVVFHYTENQGKSLVIEAEALPLAMPEEKRVYVVDTLIRD